jgi:hypothetical protein
LQKKIGGDIGYKKEDDGGNSFFLTIPTKQKESEIFHLIYQSTSATPYDYEHIKNIVESLKVGMISNNLTGLLVYNDNTFLHYIEGEKRDVEDIYYKIRLQDHHFNIVKILSATRANRLFPTDELMLLDCQNGQEMPSQLEKVLSEEGEACSLMKTFIYH